MYFVLFPLHVSVLFKRAESPSGLLSTAKSVDAFGDIRFAKSPIQKVALVFCKQPPVIDGWHLAGIA